MKLPRKGILIRLAIYVPLISFLSYNAFKGRCGAEEQPAATPAAPGKQRTMTMPDGSEVHYLELTPEEAKQMGFDPGPPDQASKIEPAAKQNTKAEPAPAKTE